MEELRKIPVLVELLALGVVQCKSSEIRKQCYSDVKEQ